MPPLPCLSGRLWRGGSADGKPAAAEADAFKGSWLRQRATGAPMFIVIGKATCKASVCDAIVLLLLLLPLLLRGS